ncbi:2Fe-2S iron-sulfur cluster-binding protein [Nocardia fluminea]|uniref:2Fe-2S iron-sulfur cluster-binding protein n=1 Tax=Nocardia fluminea TaxID=134984 RepID=UPI0034230FD6
MVDITFVQPDGTRQTVQGEEGGNIMKLATANLVSGIIGECGGDLTCATCHVFVDSAWTERLSVRTADEEEMLEATSEEPTEASRLACQIKCAQELHGLVLHVPETQR